jgi:cytochrome c-type biogenesis protein CcmH
MTGRSPTATKRLRFLGVLAIALLAVISTLSTPASALGAVKPKTSLTTIERQVMCVTCKIPLNVAQSQQADRERVFIQRQIARGDNEAQVKDALVGQYGVTVLGLPRAHGFDLTAYLVPLAAVLALAATLLTLLPRWRRHARAQAETALSTSKLSATDAARLDSDLARFD